MSLDALVAEVGQALGDARRLYGPAPAPGEWSSTGGLAAGRDAVAQSSGSAAQNWSGAGSSTQPVRLLSHGAKVPMNDS